MRILLLIVLLGSCLATPARAAADHRVLVIAAPSVKNDQYRDQAALLLPAWSGLIERDFVIETRFGASTFTVTLIGKDGGEKLRRSTPLPPEELFALVDTMPMRREEMRERPPAQR
ncbi:DUF4174 domain-containing protein [Oleiharenicola lentus]|uniref:DUF4174 domain-containing protein n=1 Tax=Oleiharenicola lentus TaxID=2508720 RepID=A0A4Q1C8R3_9BACT|nr:DUF4174 domain-containing protein [Oleiharenicola lentus]RXK55345.1 DUF4174 domain-containing protein [Oleiharenicola lentus]